MYKATKKANTKTQKETREKAQTKLTNEANQSHTKQIAKR